MLLAFEAAALFIAAAASGAQPCKGTLYLTIDTGSMSQADRIASILNKYQVKATFFLANEKTVRGDYTLDDGWAPYWKARVAEGHKFGTHTWRHGYYRADLPGARVKYVVHGKVEEDDRAAVCAELNRVNTRFEQMTGRKLDPLWRAPGGHTTPNVLRSAESCGYKHVSWPEAGFLGDELPSDKYPNSMLLERALKNLKDGDILLMHTGIWSRKDPFAPMLDPLIEGLKAKGFCFATIP
jgi:peptidoglycan/xylan/chitin deacetylase (PgdA/CDA1 family)